MTAVATKPTLWEREAVLGSVHDLLDRLRQGRGSALFVIGEGGLGKTAVLTHAQSRAGRDVQIGLGRGDQMEASLPLGLVSQALRVPGAKGLLARSRQETTPAEARAGKFYRVVQWLAEVPRPVLFALDDLHWGDADSVALVSYLCRRLDSLPAAVIATLRPWPPAAAEAVQALAHSGDASVGRLSRLSPAAACQLIASRVGGDVEEAEVGWAIHSSEGNPFLLEQACAAMRSGDDRAASRQPRSDVGNSGLLTTRFAGLCDYGMRCARAASVLGDRFLLPVALEVARLDGSAAECAESALWQSGLIREVDWHKVEFVHPLFRQALYDGLGMPAQRRLHERAFDTLLEWGQQSEAAEQALRAGLVGRRDAIELLTETGSAALRSGSVEAAVTHLEAAVRYAGCHACPELLMLLGDALVAAGQLPKAVEVLRRLLSNHVGAPATIRTRALHTLGWALTAKGSLEEGARCMEEATRTGLTVDVGVAVEPMLDQAGTIWRSEGPGPALARFEEARELAKGSRCSGRWLRAHLEWSRCALESGNPKGVAEIRSAAKALLRLEVEHVVATPWWSDVLLTHAEITALLEEFEESEGSASLVLELAEKVGAPLVIARAAAIHASVLHRRGRLAEALSLLESALGLPGIAPASTIAVGVRMAAILHHLGRTEESEEWCRRIESMPSAADGWRVRVGLLQIRGERLLHRGDSASAREAFARIGEIIDRAGVGEPCLLPWQRHGIVAALACRDDAAAEAIVASLESSSASVPCRWPGIAAATGRALRAEAAGDASGAADHFQRALDLHREVDLPLEEIETLVAYGGFLRRRGEVVRSRQVLADTVRTSENLGAAWLTGLAHEELKVARGRRRRRAEPDRLTPQELRVAELAAAGLSNRQIAGQLHLSENTIEAHLARVFGKLGISSRGLLQARKEELLNSG